MATLTIRKIPDEQIQQLKEVAEKNNRSMESQVRSILEEWLAGTVAHEITRKTNFYDEIREFMHVLDVMQTNLVKTGLIGDESRYPSLEIQEQDASKSQVPQESQVPQKTCDDYASNNRDARDEYVSHVLRISQEMAIARNRK